MCSNKKVLSLGVLKMGIIWQDNYSIWTRERKDNSYESIGKLINGRYLSAIYRKFSKYDYFIITAYDIRENYKKDFIERELRKL
ncbi:MAG: hypothetical protein JXJ04_26020 [Spirochaetales bacterium]|nr:hypothetical protein [Spirochaetales bacterium]